MRDTKTVISFLLTALLLLPMQVYAENDSETFTLSGFVYNSDGNLASSTSIKVDSMTSVWSENGEYSFSGITPGEHTVRAYFMNDGHTVVYRKMFFSGDMQLDWHEGKNWITVEVFDDQGLPIEDNSLNTVELVNADVSKALNDARAEFGPYEIGEYFTLRADYGSIDGSSQYVHFKLEPGSATSSGINDFKFHYGKNSVYGFITDLRGEPLPDVVVSDGNNSIVSNIDGFYLLQNLEVGSEQQITMRKNGVEIIAPLNHTILSGQNLVNVSSDYEGELPGDLYFTTQMQTLTMSPVSIEWEGGVYTDYFSLYAGEVEESNLIYRGTADSFIYTPTESGTMQFNIVANNTNGSNVNPQPLLMIFLPASSNEELWSAGMSWNYSLLHAPTFHQNKTYTVIGSEVVVDAFDRNQDTFLLRVSDDNYEDGERAYRWVDSTNLLNIRTYWVDAPSSSSYFQEGQLGWNFTNNGQEVDLLSGEIPTNLHFNRTNIIGVPGHPNGYDDTMNTVFVQHGVEITTPAGTFLTTYISITDESDTVISWEMWYNSSVRNYVKIIDRLPGSHSEMVTYELTGYDLPTTPQFVSEKGNLSVKDYTIEWAEFTGASKYQLLENGVVIHEGNSTSFQIENRSDGSYLYEINAFMELGFLIRGGEIEINVNFIPPVPFFFTPSQEIINEDLVELSWSSIPDAMWYSVIVQDSDGKTVEVYNGTENNTILPNLSPGQNRIRVNVMVSDKISEYSPSIFIDVKMSPSKESGGLLPSLSSGYVIMILLLSSLIYSHRRIR